MPAKRYRVRLTEEERTQLDAQVNTGAGSARRLRRARILLMADEEQAGGGWTDAEIAKALGAHARTVERIRARLSPPGLKLHHMRPQRKRACVVPGLMGRTALKHKQCPYFARNRPR